MNLSHDPNVGRRGFTVLEILVVLSLMVTVALVATRLFRSTLRLTHQADASADMVARVDDAMRVLRGDVWSAGRIQTDDERTVTLTGGDGAVITWHLLPGGTLTRDAEGASSGRRAWKALTLPMTFRAEGAGLVIDIADMPEYSGGTTHLVSQLLLLKGGTP